MKRFLSAPFKRVLALSLVLVLLFALIPALPLTADAAVETAGWEYNSSYSNYYTTAQFYSADADLVFEDDQPYDWKVLFNQSYSKISPTITAKVKDSNGTQIGNTVTKSATLEKNKQYTILEASDFPALTTDLLGEFTVTMEMYNGSTFMARMTKTFSRKASVTIVSSLSSRSMPDLVFTVADPLDLVLNIKKVNGIAESFNAAITVTGSNSNELLAARGVSLPASTNTSLILKDLVDIPAITATGKYTVNLVLTDNSGNIKHQASYDFTVVGLVRHISCEITSATNSKLTFLDDQAYDLAVQLMMEDTAAESITAAVTVTNSAGNVVFSQEQVCNIPAGGTFSFTPDLSGLTAAGEFQMQVVLTDAKGNERGSTSTSFRRIDTTSMAVTLTNAASAESVGRIYTNSSTVKLKLSISYPNGIGQTLLVRHSIAANGADMMSKETSTVIPSSGTQVVYLSLTDALYYGQNDITVEVCTPDGTVLQTAEYSYTRVLSTADPGELPILNLNDHFTSGKGDGPTKISLASNTGANMWRACIPWATIEKSKGSYDISVVKSVMDATKSNGMQALVILAYNNDLYGSANPSDSTWLNAYANYCYYVADMMARYYPNQIVGFEIWNEWNHATMSKVDAQYRTGTYYAEVVKAASAKIKQVNQKRGTNFKVIAGAVSGNTTNAGTDTFVRAMFAVSSVADAIDGFSFHTYATNETTTWNDKIQGQRVFERVSPAEFEFSAKVADVKQVLKECNVPDRVEIWLTETGWATNEIPETASPSQTSDGKTHITIGSTEQEAAAYMVQLYTWALVDGTLDRIFIYDFMNDRNDTTKVWSNNYGECNYGQIHNWGNSGDQPLAYSAKQGYIALCAMSSMLSGAAPQGTISLGSGVSAYKFTNAEGKTMVVAWTTDNTTKALSCSGSMTVTDMYGNATGDLTSTTLSECPIYILYSGTLTVG